MDADSPAVFFLSDYGTADEFVGVVHAVLHRLAPARPVIDLSHRIPPFDVDSGASMLVRCAPFLGPGVVLAVVDPGVGTARRGVAIGTAGDGPAWLVGPDNGLLVPIATELGGAAGVIQLDPSRAGPGRSGPVGRTFDGRDVFAPAAAHLVMGGRPEDLGVQVDPASLTTRVAAGPTPETRVESTPAGWAVVTTVTWVDHFGNVQLRLRPAVLEEIGLLSGGTATARVEGEGAVRRRSVPVRRVLAFAELGDGEYGLALDANGRMALVLDRASAAQQLGISGRGQTVRISVTAPDGTGP